MLHELKRLLDVALYQSPAYENIAGFLRVNRAVGDFAIGHNDQAKQADLFERHHLTAIALPMRMQIGSPAQFAAQSFQPVAVNVGHGAGKHARSLHHLGGHNPAGGTVKKAGAGKYHHLSAPGRAKDIFLLFFSDVR